MVIVSSDVFRVPLHFSPSDLTVLCLFFFPILGSKEAIFSIAIPGFPINGTVGNLFSVAVVLLISGLHYLGVRPGTVTQNILTTLKIGSLLGIIFLGVLFGKETRLISAHYSIGRKSPILVFLRRRSYRRFLLIQDGTR